VASLADLLAYQQDQRNRLNSLVPVPVLGTATDISIRPSRVSPLSLGQRVENLSAAAGEGFADQAKGILDLLTTDPRTTLKTMYQAGKAAVQNPRGVYQAAKEGLAKATESPEATTKFIAQNFSPLELASGLGKLGKMQELIVYHGTPHTFEATAKNPLGEFSAEKIGKGEGRQVYGYGAYVAESPEIGKNFQETLKHRNYAAIQQNAPNNYKVVAKDGTVLSDNVYYHQAKKIKDQYDEAQKGSLYTADLPDEMIDKMLQWDKPLSEQNEFVKNALIKTGDPTILKMVNETPVNKGDYWEFLGNTYNSKQEALKDATGAEITFGRTGLGKSPKEVSEKLLAAGIPGVQYMQPHGRQELRNTRNFVVFPGEEQNLKILKRE